jgi:hypothetical protein
MTLSRIALREGNRAAAVAHLREAASVPPSEELSDQQGVTIHRALKPLRDAGERQAVIDYLERMAERSVVERTRLRQSADAIRAGRMPDWYQYQSAGR